MQICTTTQQSVIYLLRKTINFAKCIYRVLSSQNRAFFYILKIKNIFKKLYAVSFL